MEDNKKSITESIDNIKNPPKRRKCRSSRREEAMPLPDYIIFNIACTSSLGYYSWI